MGDIEKIKIRLLSKLSISKDDKRGLSLTLLDYEHLDYIEDVFVEYFDILCGAKIVDNENQKYILCFDTKISFNELSSIIDRINSYHEEHCELYDTV